MNIKQPTIQGAKLWVKNELYGLYPENEIDNFNFLIIEHLFHFSRLELHLNKDRNISPEQMDALRQFTQQLQQYKPIQYILGKTEFYGLTFHVDNHVLIPRPETEEMVDLIVREKSNQRQVILDVGTGSGCIAVSLAKFIPGAQVDALDISSTVLEIARKNATENNVNIRFFKSDALLPDINLPAEEYSVIVSNPPYVRMSERKFMSKNVLDYEPPLALFVDDKDPLVFYTALASIGKKYLTRKGVIYAEINEAFGNEVKQLFQGKGYHHVEIIKDLQKKNRILKAFSYS
jgi:release factor glutamine methyltransferase